MLKNLVNASNSNNKKKPKNASLGTENSYMFDAESKQNHIVLQRLLMENQA